MSKCRIWATRSSRVSTPNRGTSNYSIVSNQVDVGSTEGDVYWSGTAFGADQEVFVTLTTVDANASEQDLLLKSQSNSNYLSGVIEVLYEAANHRVQVWTYTGSQMWVQRGADMAVTFANGDQFGARARPNGMVDVYRNGVLLGTRDVTAWPYYASGGYIGLWFVNAGNAVLDNFGGGTSLSAWVPAKHGLASLARPAGGVAPLWAWLGERWAQLESLLRAPRRSVLTAPPAGQVWKSYYFAGSQRVAMRVEGDAIPGNNGVFWLHTDHLGSTALATDGNGTVVANSRRLYDAWGNLRVKGTGLQTTVGFTGQRLDSYIKLVQMGTRWYDPAIGRWLSPDTIVPQPGNPQDLNRYSYTRNNPLKYIDPSGHIAEGETKDANDIVEELRDKFGVWINADWYGMGKTFHGGVWKLFELTAVRDAVREMADKLGGAPAFRGITPNNAFVTWGGWIPITRLREPGGGDEFKGEVRLRDGVFTSGTTVRNILNIKVAIVHEIAHAWDYGSNYLLLNRLFNMNGPIMDGLHDFVGNESAPTAYGASADPREEWAESVASFVYPDYIASLQTDQREVARSTAGSPRPGLGPLHFSYVALQIMKLPSGLDYLDPRGSQ